VAGHVRSALAEQGWQVAKVPGFARKRHMLRALRQDVPASALVSAAAPADAIIIGAGIAGCSMAEALARRGWTLTLLERNGGPAAADAGRGRQPRRAILAGRVCLRSASAAATGWPAATLGQGGNTRTGRRRGRSRPAGRPTPGHAERLCALAGSGCRKKADR